MGLGDIKKKSESLGKKNLSTFLKVNKYDNPQNAMDLIGHICTMAKDIDYSDEFFKVYDILFEMDDRQKSEGFVWYDDLFSKIHEVLKTLEKTYLDNTFQLKIAVSGGYSAGKSTFMNMLIGEKEFLPTDMNPTSLVNTYINFNGQISQPIVRGENIKNDLVRLDEDVLASIRHDTQNAKAIANVLRRLIIDIPCKNYLDGITFIDTPGYDNSMNVNRENGTTDKDTASKAFKDANVIFWCANIGKQVTNEDLKFIKENGGDDKPVVILLSRMKSKAASDVPVIVQSCYNTATKYLKNVMDVIAFDRDASLDEVCSIKRNNFAQLFSKIKAEQCETAFELCSFFISDLFENEKSESKKFQDDKQNEYNNVISKLNKARKNSSDLKTNNRDFVKDLKEVLIDDYNKIDEGVDMMVDSSSNAIGRFADFYNSVNDWDKNEHSCWDNTLRPKIWDASGKYDAAVEMHNKAYDSLKGLFSSEEYRKSIVEWVDNRLKALSDQDVYDVDNLEDQKKELTDRIKIEKKRQQCVVEYQPRVLNALRVLDEECLTKRKKHYSSLQQLEKTKDDDIFSAISGNNIQRFILCFHNGVDLSSCNSQGYNVLTWIAAFGNTEMIKFIIKHKDDRNGIDLTIKDKNGFDIMETSVIAHNKRACEMLQNAEPSMKLTKSTMEQLASKNDFNLWINNCI